jgi:hypothetical protein
MYTGWQRYGRDVDARVRARVAGDAALLRSSYGAALWAMERYLAANGDVAGRIRDLRRDIEREFGMLSRVVNRAAGQVLLWTSRREALAYPSGRPLEPRTFVDRRNWA